LLIFGAGLAWLLPALVVYTVKALSWRRRSTALLLIWLLTIMLALFVGLILDTVSSANWVPLATAGALWLAAPVFPLLRLRRRAPASAPLGHRRGPRADARAATDTLCQRRAARRPRTTRSRRRPLAAPWPGSSRSRPTPPDWASPRA